MSVFGKVSYTNNESASTETVTQSIESTSQVQEQVEKFDTSYNTEKLQELYAEYDKITIDEEKIKSFTQTKTNAVSTAVPFRLILGISTTAIVSLLLIFLCVYNIFVINGLNGNIQYLQEEVISCEQRLIESEGIYNSLITITDKDMDTIKNELHYVEPNIDSETGESTSFVIETVTVSDKAEVIELQGETNWFDAFCNFLSRVFG